MSKSIFSTAQPVVLGVVLLLALGTACDTTFEEPEIEFVELAGWNLGGDGLSVEVELAVTNPNAFSATVRRTDYVLWLNEVEVGEGNAEDLHLVAGETTTVFLPLTLAFEPLFEAAMAGDWPDVAYSLRGEAEVSSLAGSREVDFRRSGVENVPINLDLLRFFD